MVFCFCFCFLLEFTAQYLEIMLSDRILQTLIIQILVQRSEFKILLWYCRQVNNAREVLSSCGWAIGQKFSYSQSDKSMAQNKRAHNTVDDNVQWRKGCCVRCTLFGRYVYRNVYDFNVILNDICVTSCNPHTIEMTMVKFSLYYLFLTQMPTKFYLIHLCVVLFNTNFLHNLFSSLNTIHVYM